MPTSESARSAAAIHRKLRALSAVFLDPAATEHEKANAKGLKGRLERQLSQEATPEGAWTGIMFRLGRGVKEITSPLTTNPQAAGQHDGQRETSRPLHASRELV
jgi:hypothetical protein